ncbi:Uncharacterised protein [Mycobacteroides abscessus subsp. abscessus]|nr:Uncharacterised protein [Mycobacteroides abscessus subsp. abscessus]
MGDEDDRLAQFPLQAQQPLLQVAAHQRVDGPERFVHQQDVRVGRQRPGDTHPLLLTARELVRVAVGHGPVEADQVHQFVGPGAGLLAAGAVQHRDSGDVVDHLAVRQQPALLHHVADPSAQVHRVEGGDVLVVDQHASGAGVDHPVDHPHQGGLAAAAGPDEHGGRVAGHDRAEVLDGGGAVGVALGDVLELDHGGSSLLGRWCNGDGRRFVPGVPRLHRGTTPAADPAVLSRRGPSGTATTDSRPCGARAGWSTPESGIREPGFTFRMDRPSHIPPWGIQ